MSKFLNRFFLTVAVATSAVVIIVASAFADTGSANSGEQLQWQVVSGGGSTNGTSPSYKLSSTVGQTAAGAGSSSSYKLNQGFQQNFTSASCFCGDADGNGLITISDAVFLISYIFVGGTAPNPICHGDADGTGIITISDAVFLINYIFGGGPTPHCP